MEGARTPASGGFLRPRFGPWAASFLLLLPVVVVYVAHYGRASYDPEIEATGFIQYDMAYYLANAREHFDSGSFTLTYGNPFSPSADTPRVYFQPFTLALAAAWLLTRLDPGAIYVGAGFLLALACIRVSLALYERRIGFGSVPRTAGVACFVWGGRHPGGLRGAARRRDGRGLRRPLPLRSRRRVVVSQLRPQPDLPDGSALSPARLLDRPGAREATAPMGAGPPAAAVAQPSVHRDRVHPDRSRLVAPRAVRSVEPSRHLGSRDRCGGAPALPRPLLPGLPPDLAGARVADVPVGPPLDAERPDDGDGLRPGAAPGAVAGAASAPRGEGALGAGESVSRRVVRGCLPAGQPRAGDVADPTPPLHAGVPLAAALPARGTRPDRDPRSGARDRARRPRSGPGGVADGGLRAGQRGVALPAVRRADRGVREPRFEVGAGMAAPVVRGASRRPRRLERPDAGLSRDRAWYSHWACTPFASERLSELERFFRHGTEPPSWAGRPLAIVYNAARGPSELPVQAFCDVFEEPLLAGPYRACVRRPDRRPMEFDGTQAILDPPGPFWPRATGVGFDQTRHGGRREAPGPRSRPHRLRSGPCR